MAKMPFFHNAGSGNQPQLKIRNLVFRGFDIFIPFPYLFLSSRGLFEHAPFITKFLPAEFKSIVIVLGERCRLFDRLSSSGKALFLDVPVATEGIGWAFF